MNKKGFTLVEMIVTMTLLCTILLLVIPSILSQLSSKTSELESAEQTIIEEAAKAYVSKHNEEYAYIDSNKTYCISIETLKKEGLYTPSSRTKFFGSDENYSVKVVVEKETKKFDFQNIKCS